ncbi:DUF6049 family protein [Nocardioides sp. MAHUQ-72]|uniref:DUF6049 family protein n=1 Tax=unclassified Nocardioides TaxID=2615069 RepID=UPI0036246161
MPRPTSLLAALVAVAAAFTGGCPAAVAADPGLAVGASTAVVRPGAAVARTQRPPATQRTPLSVTIDSLSPAVVPRKGPIRVTGSVTNEDDGPWTSVQVFAFLGDTPLTTPAELDEASGVAPEADVGARITSDGFDTIDRIEPGESRQFSILVTQSQITVTEAGVYWFGVHALGSGPEGRVDGADGRARTFLPLVPRTREPVDTALVLPLRRTVSYAPDGSIEDLEGWDESLDVGGRLRAMVDFGAAAGSRPITWLLDPALPDVVRTLTLGNPPRSLAPSLPESGDGGSDGPSSDPSATAEPAPSADASDDAAAAAESTDPRLGAVAESGTDWLNRLHEALAGQQVLALPYGDLDVAAAAEHDPRLYRRARQRSGTELAPWGLPMSPGVSSPDGFLDEAAIRATPRRSTILVTDEMLGAGAPPVIRTAGRRVVTTSSGATSGGPGPDDPLGLVTLRQRILAEAAVRELSPGDPPLVVVLPSYWTPGPAAGFFEGLDQDWLDLTSVSDVAVGRARPVDARRLEHPRTQESRELPAANFASARRLVRVAETLQNVLTVNTTVADAAADQSMVSTSFGHRADPAATRASTDRARSWIEQQVASVRIDAPPAVTLSSRSGRFAATITNGLDEPVTVRIRAITDEPDAIRGPEKVEIGPGGQTTVLLNASFSTLGIHNVTLFVTDSDNRPLGSSDQLPIRSAQVSQIIWLILGAGVALLFGAIAVRLVRRVRAAAHARQSS